MTTIAEGRSRRRAVRAWGDFAPYHRWDHNFFLSMVALIWFVVLMGFVPAIWTHVVKHKPPYPTAVQIHAAAMVAWLALLTTQVLLIRARRTDLHRKLGVAGICLACLIPFLGIAAAIVVDRAKMATHPDPAFLSVQLFDMVAFAGAAAAAILMREPAAHKRLILLATLACVDAGFSRWLGRPLTKILGDGFVPFMIESYLGNIVLILAIGGYDLATRRRLNGAFVGGAAWVLGCLFLAGWLYVTPAWAPFAARLIGR
ncbi:MAG TPA: hypothetical protein VGG68_09525 [Caulobacteraceae bacterium]|jgi:hypothetical protein